MVAIPLLPQYAARRPDDNIDHLINTIQEADAMDLLARLPDKSVNIITDPPYGINQDKGNGKYNKSATFQRNYNDSWDGSRPEKVVFDEMLRVSKLMIVFGANYFSDLLPQANHWIVWDKLVTMPSYSKCELVWTNYPANTVQKITRQMNGMIGGIRDRIHPTQKPVDLLIEIILAYTRPGDIICDPFVGSGTTAIAARNTNRRFICGDNSAEYVALARKRLADTDPYQATELSSGLVQKSLFAEIIERDDDGFMMKVRL